MNDEDLRDLFAGLALQGLLSRGDVYPIADYAEASYNYADAMIKAKYKKDEPEEGITSVIKRTKKKNV
jgi:hypothetical protein